MQPESLIRYAVWYGVCTHKQFPLALTGAIFAESKIKCNHLRFTCFCWFCSFTVHCLQGCSCMILLVQGTKAPHLHTYIKKFKVCLVLLFCCLSCSKSLHDRHTDIRKACRVQLFLYNQMHWARRFDACLH